jgi:hypothetical protein
MRAAKWGQRVANSTKGSKTSFLERDGPGGERVDAAPRRGQHYHKLFVHDRRYLSGEIMDLFDFFFPEQAQAQHLRTIAHRVAAPSSAPRQSDEAAALRADVKFLTLVLCVILKRLTETKTMSLADLKDLVDEVDALDGARDGGLEPGVLRGLLGVLKQDVPAAEPGGPKIEIKTSPYDRYRR